MTERLTALDVVCFKWGERYPSTYANRLRGMLLRHLDADLTFHCVTDDPAGLHPDFMAHDIAQFQIEGWDMGHGLKLSAFSRDFLGLAGRHILIMDLDMVVLDDMSYVLDRPDEDFIITPGHNQYAGTRGHSALYRIRVGSRPDVWEELIADPAATVSVYQHHNGGPGQLSEQRWLERCFEQMEFFPEGMLAYYRQDCDALGPGKTAVVPAGARVVSFAGRVDPVHVQHSDYGDWRHAPWVAEHWRE